MIVKKTLGAFGAKIDVLVNNAGGLFARKTIEEVADLESDDTSFITGNNIDINGGLAFSEFLFFKD